MAEYLKELVDKNVSVVTNDGKNYIGVLKGLDQTTNIILSECYERVFSEIEDCEIFPLGLFIIRGDNVAVIGEVDDDKSAQVSFESIRAAPLKPIVH